MGIFLNALEVDCIQSPLSGTFDALQTMTFGCSMEDSGQANLAGIISRFYAEPNVDEQYKLNNMRNAYTT